VAGAIVVVCVSREVVSKASTTRSVLLALQALVQCRRALALLGIIVGPQGQRVAPAPDLAIQLVVAMASVRPPACALVILDMGCSQPALCMITVPPTLAKMGPPV
jgi:hypothetical protein